jgi:hypothetical protein
MIDIFAEIRDFSALIRDNYDSHFYQLNMFELFISVDTTLISINWICLRYLSTLIELSFLSTEYVWDIYQVDIIPFYQLNMCWVFIKLICVGYLSSLYNSILSTEYVWDISTLLDWISINLIQLHSIKLICVGYLSSWVDICWIFIKLICVGYLSSLYNSHFYRLNMCWISIKLI